MKRRVIVPIICLLLLAGCATGPNAPIDQAIQFRSGFNTILSQWNMELSGMPLDQQRQLAQIAMPFVQAGVAALDAMDLAVGAGGQPTPETIQQYLAAKNKLIDILAQLVLAKKERK